MKGFYPTLLLVLVIPFLRADPTWTAERRANQRGEIIPKSLSLYLRRYLPDLEILPKEDFVAYTAGARPDQPSPFICSGEFNGDGRKDFALLLKHKVNQTLKLLAFHQKKKQTYTHFVVEDLWGIKVEEGKKVHLFIECEKPGKKQDIEGGPVINLKTNSISLGAYGEAGSGLYYFGNNQYKWILTGD